MKQFFNANLEPSRTLERKSDETLLNFLSCLKDKEKYLLFTNFRTHPIPDLDPNLNHNATKALQRGTSGDLQHLEQLHLTDLRLELDQRLKPSTHHLTHSEFCAFRSALVRNPTLPLAPGEDSDEPYTKLFQKVQIYLSDQRLRDHLLESSQAKCFSVLEDGIHSRNRSRTTDHPSPTRESDLITGTIMADCKYCLAWIYELALLEQGHVLYNQDGWSLLAIAIEADAGNVIDILISHSGNDPFAPYRVWEDGRIGSSIVKFAASAQALPNPSAAHDDCLWAVLEWCREIFTGAELRVGSELGAKDCYRLAQLGSVRVAKHLMQHFGLDITATACGRDGKTIWHAAITASKFNPVFMTWLKVCDPFGINKADDNGVTPLWQAIQEGRRPAAEWLIAEMDSAQIRLGQDRPDEGEGSWPAILGLAMRSWNKDSVAILRALYHHPRMEAWRDGENIAKLVTQLTSDYAKRNSEIAKQFHKKIIAKGTRQTLDNGIRKWVGGKCQVLIEDASPGVFAAPAFRETERSASDAGIAWLKHFLTPDGPAKKRFRADERAEVCYKEYY